MKKALCILTALFAISWASAQTSSSGQTTGSSDKSAASSTSQETEKGATKGTKKGAGERTITGCLSKEDGNYALQHGSRKIEVTSSEDLSKHVGHTVKLHGTWAKAAATGEAATTEKGGKKGGARQFEAASIEHVSDTCEGAAGMGEHKMNHHHKMGGGAAASPSPSPSPQK